MQQVIQYQKTGEITVEQLPAPQLKAGGVLVRNGYSLISAGTERSSVETAQANLLGKARSRPDLVRQVLDNYKREGLLATYRKVQNRLDNYKDLGYCCAGIVVESSCDGLAAGDRVACAGVGYASHAEYVFVPRNLAVRVPDAVGLAEAAFATPGAIALQGVRQADVRVGERVVVLGLGLLGLLSVQLLKASGCLVFGLDISPRNFELARKLGCDEVGFSGEQALPAVESFTRSYGADAVLITAASLSQEPVELACRMARRRGRVVVVGAVPLAAPRTPAYEKELEFRMSCSYGPGRYDGSYEEGGHDYPQAYVRWTENRNLEAVLDLIAARKLDVRALATHTFDIGHALQAYDVITQKTPEPYVAVLISYAQPEGESLSRKLVLAAPRASSDCRVGVIGAGNHVQSYLLPSLQKLGVALGTVAGSKPVNAKSAALKFGFAACATDPEEIFRDESIDVVLIGSRHDSHARYVAAALRAGKHVFVEKPPAVTAEQLDSVIEAYNLAARQGAPPLVMAGYNRRFSAPAVRLKRFFAGRMEPLAMSYRVNAGFVPKSNWYQAPGQGGRVIGEIGHFIDLMQFLTDSVPLSVYAVGPEDSGDRYCRDNVDVSLTFSDGSVGHIFYLANGAGCMPKEYLEVFGGGKSATLDSYKRLVLFEGRKSKTHSFSGGKGHEEEMQALVEAVRSGRAPVAWESLIATSRASFAVMESLRSRLPVLLG